MVYIFLITVLLVLWFYNENRLHATSVKYNHADTTLEGYIAYTNYMGRKRPAVLLINESGGPDSFIKERARKIAKKLGYVAFAVDMYGEKMRPKDKLEMMTITAAYLEKKELMRSRARAALHKLLDNNLVDPQRVAVVGYGFGGSVALELARSGADIKGAVSFYGRLDTIPSSGSTKTIKARIMTLRGAGDPFVSRQEVLAFENEMSRSKADWQMIVYGDAAYGFANPVYNNSVSDGIIYSKKIDERAWKTLKLFFREIFEYK